MSSQERVKSAERVFKILNAFTIEAPELNIEELSEASSSSKSATRRLLNCMQAEGFIIKDSDTKRFRLGYGVIRLGEIVLNSINIRKLSLPFLKNLRDITGETAGLNIVSANSRICIEKAESYHNLRRFIDIGRPLPLYAGASGKVLLAYQDRGVIMEFLNGAEIISYTDNTVTDTGKIMDALNIIRENGYCVSYGEHSPGATSISAPVLDHNVNIVAGINISGPSSRFTREKIDSYIETVKYAAGAISKHIGCNLNGGNS